MRKKLDEFEKAIDAEIVATPGLAPGHEYPGGQIVPAPETKTGTEEKAEKPSEPPVEDAAL